MARNTFISYKHSESQRVRDEILEALGKDATYYRGETSDSPNLSDATTEAIKDHLRDMLFHTSVTIVVVSPRATQSEWMDWEIEYSLKEISRQGRTSGANGVLAVVAPSDGDCSWLISHRNSEDGCRVRHVDESKLFDIVNRNRFNRKKKEFACAHCRTYDALSDSYISVIEKEAFLGNPTRYIENAFKKSEEIEEFEIEKKR